ncbi:MAG: FAD-binding protein [Candidatus Aminicenantes bacterium]|jgi:succinate dehydrogenase/fumarate reductase flavoprotein subunit
MKKDVLKWNGVDHPVYSLNTFIIGSGAAALNAAVHLWDRGQTNIAIATDHWGGGTSNNAGSDKQTYYKLSLSSKTPDSPEQMAQDLFAGGCMHGDIALCEAQNSLEAFFHLVRLGVPFPHDRYGTYVGFKTDHDPRGRGTSAGPLTSHLMFEALAREVRSRSIPVFDACEVIALLTEKKDDETHVIGAIALDKNKLDTENLGFVIFNATNVILGTGGPAGIYKTSVYPESQVGSTGLALAIGAVANNLTESQYGLASVKFRWNLSGSYQQVIPRYVSAEKNGSGEREFLNDYFPDMEKLATAIFFKGYQWPFDPRKLENFGSSLIDILVYQETVLRGRKVFLDFTRNPSGEGNLSEFSFDLLDKEAYQYLKNSSALQDTPFERLEAMNRPAIDLYKEHGIDIGKDLLEIAVCAQHNNGGLMGNIWWESNIKHLFPVGEVNGSHGVYRPGGSALNSGQVGGMRAAMFIVGRYHSQPPDLVRFLSSAEAQIREKIVFAETHIDKDLCGDSDIHIQKNRIQERMSACGAHIRDPLMVKKAIDKSWNQYSKLQSDSQVSSAKGLPALFKNLDVCLTHALYLEAIGEYLAKGGRSRGSFLVLDPEGEKPCDRLGENWRFSLNSPDSFVSTRILEIFLDEDKTVQKRWIDIRPIPRAESWFEKVWNDYRNDKIIG